MSLKDPRNINCSWKWTQQADSILWHGYELTLRAAKLVEESYVFLKSFSSFPGPPTMQESRSATGSWQV